MERTCIGLVGVLGDLKWTRIQIGPDRRPLRRGSFISAVKVVNEPHTQIRTSVRMCVDSNQRRDSYLWPSDFIKRYFKPGRFLIIYSPFGVDLSKEPACLEFIGNFLSDEIQRDIKEYKRLLSIAVGETMLADGVDKTGSDGVGVDDGDDIDYY